MGAFLAPVFISLDLEYGEYLPSGDVFPKNGRGQSVGCSGELN